jgi:hypothetical protein
MEEPSFEDLQAILSADPDFTALRTSREQSIFCCQLFRESGNFEPPISFTVIGSLLSLNSKTVWGHWKHFEKYGMCDGPSGRPSVLTPAQMEILIQEITQGYHSQLPLSLSEITHFIKTYFEIDIIPDTLRHILRREEKIKAVEGVPMEETRVFADHDEIVRYLTELAELIIDVPAYFVFNMDEMGHQDWADRQVSVVYVPSEEPNDQIPIPIDRGGKRLTLVATIAADGSALKPMIIVERHTCDSDLRLFGIDESKCLIVFQKSGFITKALFDDWFGQIFLPEVRHRREVHGYDGPVVLLFDGCTAHDTDYFLDMCFEESIVPIPIPPHSSNQLQPCDLCLFGATKQAIHRMNTMMDGNPQSVHIARVVGGYIAAATPMNIVASFRNAGLSLCIDQEGCLKMSVTTESIRCLITKLDEQERRMIHGERTHQSPRELLDVDQERYPPDMREDVLQISAFPPSEENLQVPLYLDLLNQEARKILKKERKSK